MVEVQKLQMTKCQFQTTTLWSHVAGAMSFPRSETENFLRTKCRQATSHGPPQRWLWAAIDRNLRKPKLRPSLCFVVPPSRLIVGSLTIYEFVDDKI